MASEPGDNDSICTSLDDRRDSKASDSRTNNRALPPLVLSRIFEYVFWEAPRNADECCGLSNHATRHFCAVSTLPVGHHDLLGALHTCHRWRRRAARLFYGTVVVAVGTGTNTALEEHERPTDLRRRRVASTVRLVLESGYAPKTARLLVYTHAACGPAEVAAAVEPFARFEWAGITHLHYYDPARGRGGRVVTGQWAHDQAIGMLNRRLAASLPRLQHVSAVSATRDSFGVFVLDALVAARRRQLRSLEALAEGGAMALMAADQDDVALGVSALGLRSLGAPSSAVVRVPRATATLLEKLDVGPLAADGIWAPFGGGGDFVRLRLLRLEFAGRLAHRGHRRSASDDAAVVDGAYPGFPALRELTVAGFPLDATRFLENFPRAQLQHVALVGCAHVLGLALAPFGALRSLAVEVPDAFADRPLDGARVSRWLAQLLQSSHVHLSALSVTVPAALQGFEVDVPAGVRLAALQHLTLDVGLRLDELEELLLALPRLVTLRVVAAEVHTRAHEYLSRRARPKKYPIDRARRRRVLSATLEMLAVRLADPLLNCRRRRRALAKTAWLAARTPAVLRLATQPEAVHTLRRCLRDAAKVTGAPHSTAHLAGVRVEAVWPAD
ncbi:hypothetical protein GGI15_001723 [Coemansia interrupta]|uniref:Uncharacterized protein n=1 Tax=Coemansia interrupta TaxID=1126814 RepID=A0A9W8HM18_9FUNG|nr:hypothetical protein GGI15_001723 [Coemansia interrupta]